MKSEHIKHLYNRIGFGITPKELNSLAKKSKEDIVNIIFKDSKKHSPIKVETSFLKTFSKDDLKNKKKKIEFQKNNRKKLEEFGVAWFHRLKNPSEVFREKMTLFWANHFVCKSNKVLYIEKYNNVLRENAFGNLGDFLKKISREAAMIEYLNIKQNRKKKPNENFARELMELFTLGHDNYTQKDISESARSFTGYNIDFWGGFIMKKNLHDENEKIFFNKRGKFKGDDIIDIILEQKQCAKFLSEKIYAYFVNENINQNHINLMVDVFYKDYDVERLMRFILLSEWFYDEKNIGSKIKSPIEFLVGINTVVPYEILKEKQIFLLQKLLGQVLMNPPNVAGWKTGRNWIDSNTIVNRLRLPSVLLNNSQITYSDKGNEKSIIKNFSSKKLRRKVFIKTKVNWGLFQENYKGNSKIELIKFILSLKLNSETEKILLRDPQMPIQDFCIELMSLPEYQLC